MKKLISVASALIVTSVVALAAQATSSYTLTIMNGTTVVSTTVIPASSFLCGQTALAGSGINPRHVEFNDPASTTGLVCIFVDNGVNGPISSLPFGSTGYTATLIATNTAGNSSASAASNSFTEPGLPPGAPTAVRVIQ